MTVISKTAITPIDNRFSTVARQAAKLLGVTVGGVVQKAHAIYDSSCHYVEIYDVPAGGMIVLSANDNLIHAAHVTDDFEVSFTPYDERDAFNENASAAGITRSYQLNREYAVILEQERYRRY